MTSKQRTEIPADVAARVLFRSSRVCCVCREARKPVQIHHIDEDPSNGGEDNLAILCFDCHHETQITGGFARKLEARQIILFRDDWHAILERSRRLPLSHCDLDVVPRALEADLEGERLHLDYLKLSERDDRYRYSFDADYPRVTPERSTEAGEVNLMLAAFVTEELQKFRASAIGASQFKDENYKRSPDSEMYWDRLSISHAVGGFKTDLLSVEFRLGSYGAGAAHSRLSTQTFNYLLKPTVRLDFWDIFRYQNKQSCFEAISKYCIFSLHEQQPAFVKTNYEGAPNPWILRGAAPDESNFKNVLLERGGVRFFFDPYSVACYAEGRYDVLVPVRVLSAVIRESVLKYLQ